MKRDPGIPEQVSSGPLPAEHTGVGAGSHFREETGASRETFILLEKHVRMERLKRDCVGPREQV